MIGAVSDFALTNQYAAFSSILTNTTGGTADDYALFMVQPSGKTVVVREGQSAAGNGKFSGIAQYSLSNRGEVAMYATGIAGTLNGVNDNEGIFRGGKFGLTQIARAGQAAPGGAGLFSSFGSVSINEAGTVGFWGYLGGNFGLFVGSGGALTKIAVTSDPAPGGNGTFSDVSGAQILSRTGYLAFRGGLTGTSGGSNDNSGIFVGNGSSLLTVVREGQSAPGGNGVFDGINFPWLNDDHTAAFYSTLRNTSGGASDNTGIFTGSGGAVTQIVRAGQSLPGGNGIFAGLNNTLSINKHGEVAFTANTGVYLGNGTTIKTIASDGDATPEGQGAFATMLLAAVNDTGTVAFTADLTDGKRGIYLGDGRETILVGREGDMVAGSVISYVGFDPKTFNDFREIAYQAILADGRMSVLLFTPRLRWRDNGNGVWDDNSKWTVSLQPAEYTRIEIDPQTGGTITGPDADAKVLSLQIGGTSVGLADLNLQPNVTLTVGEDTKVKPGGMLSGKGHLVSDVLNESIIAPGNSPGTLVIEGDLEQTATGTLQLELAGTNAAEHDLLSVTGTFELGGHIDLTLLNGFMPQLGDTFELMEADEIVENGYVVSAPALAGNLTIETGVETRGMQEVFVATVVPEPCSIAMLTAVLPLIGRRPGRGRRA
jgi:hypothetical protein